MRIKAKFRTPLSAARPSGPSTFGLRANAGSLKYLTLTLKNGFFERVIFALDFRLACPGGITTGSYHEKHSRAGVFFRWRCSCQLLHRPGKARRKQMQDHLLLAALAPKWLTFATLRVIR